MKKNEIEKKVAEKATRMAPNEYEVVVIKDNHNHVVGVESYDFPIMSYTHRIGTKNGTFAFTATAVSVEKLVEEVVHLDGSVF